MSVNYVANRGLIVYEKLWPKDGSLGNITIHRSTILTDTWWWKFTLDLTGSPPGMEKFKTASCQLALLVNNVKI